VRDHAAGLVEYRHAAVELADDHVVAVYCERGR
jgi:hypothetical protein